MGPLRRGIYLATGSKPSMTGALSVGEVLDRQLTESLGTEAVEGPENKTSPERDSKDLRLAPHPDMRNALKKCVIQRPVDSFTDMPVSPSNPKTPHLSHLAHGTY